MKCYLLVHKAHKHVVAVYKNNETAKQSMNKLNKVFNLPMYEIIESKLFLQ